MFWIIFLPEAILCWQAWVQTIVRFLSSLIITTSSLITRNTILSTGVGPNPYFLISLLVDFWRCLIHFWSKRIRWPKSRPRPTKTRPRTAQEPLRNLQEPSKSCHKPPKAPKNRPRATQELSRAAQKVQKWYKNHVKIDAKRVSWKMRFVVSLAIFLVLKTVKKRPRRV